MYTYMYTYTSTHATCLQHHELDGTTDDGAGGEHEQRRAHGGVQQVSAPPNCRREKQRSCFHIGRGGKVVNLNGAWWSTTNECI